jgi:hypothetical protein
LTGGEVEFKKIIEILYRERGVRKEELLRKSDDMVRGLLIRLMHWYGG